MDTTGVVIWGASAQGSLIVWCADSKGLAYADARDITLPVGCKAGDFVNVKTRVDDDGKRFCVTVAPHRCAHAFPEVADDIRDAARGHRGDVFSRDEFVTRLFCAEAGPVHPKTPRKGSARAGKSWMAKPAEKPQQPRRSPAAR